MSDALLSTQSSVELLSTKILEKINTKLLEQNHKPGLYVVATPIGNILDISIRAINILNRADCIFAEDTRQSRKLLDWYGIKNKLVACHEYNETEHAALINANGIYALISDAGTPAISDPGYRIVNWCLENGIDVFPVPGASSPIAAMSASGMPSDRFTFFGFVPPKEHSRQSFFDEIKNENGTLIFFESPNRLLNSLNDMLKIFGDRSCCVCRELTKIFEEFFRGNISDAIRHFSENKPVGEFVILISGASMEIDDEKNEEEIFEELKKILEEKGLKESVKIVSEKYHMQKSVVYKKALEVKNQMNI